VITPALVILIGVILAVVIVLMSSGKRKADVRGIVEEIRARGSVTVHVGERVEFRTAIREALELRGLHLDGVEFRRRAGKMMELSGIGPGDRVAADVVLKLLRSAIWVGAAHELYRGGRAQDVWPEVVECVERELEDTDGGR